MGSNRCSGAPTPDRKTRTAPKIVEAFPLVSGEIALGSPRSDLRTGLQLEVMNTERSGHAAFGLGMRLCGSGADEFLIFQKQGRQSLPKRPSFLQVVK
jgi:hypothetical protein